MKNVLLRLREMQESLNRAELSVAEYILRDAQMASTMTVRDLAKAAFASPSTIVRLARRIGFSGYKEFQQALQVDLATLHLEEPPENPTIEKNENLPSIIQKIMQQNMQSLEESAYLIKPESIARAVDFLMPARNILLFGIGASFLVCKDFQLKLLRLGRLCSLNEDLHSQYLQSMNATAEDAALVVSYSGETKEMLRCTETLRANHTPVIAISRYTVSSLSKLADVTLYTSSAEAALRLGAMSSRIAQLSLIDILYTEMIQREYDHASETLIRTQIKK